MNARGAVRRRNEERRYYWLSRGLDRTIQGNGTFPREWLVARAIAIKACKDQAVMWGRPKSPRGVWLPKAASDRVGFSC